jgi:hypothetical protein
MKIEQLKSLSSDQHCQLEMLIDHFSISGMGFKNSPFSFSFNVQTKKYSAPLLYLQDNVQLAGSVQKSNPIPAPIRPMGIFDLNRASLASMLGVITTYSIVLLQLKM